jgi:hypothetical protein
VPPEQNPEQQVPPAVHALPTVEHVVLSGLQVPLLHVWLQHWPLVVQAVLSERHCG